ncbi:Exocyst complex component SEC8 [Labeo rohita]|uniref:Exocyst complex component SEC8 n=1 Tax=Labeo rohita TaxID=84645 RepID=A0ABQ8L7Z4_LABRO|nr:Exocyst complex component SEC8 [Labeo rohita]
MDVSVDMHDYTLTAVTDPGFGKTLDTPNAMKIEGLKKTVEVKDLRGVPEKEEENIRDEVIHMCEQTYPDSKGKFSFAIDSVHRLGKKKNQIGSKTVPRTVIVQFTSRIVWDAVWKAAKSLAYFKGQWVVVHGRPYSTGQRKTKEAVAYGRRSTRSWKNCTLHGRPHLHLSY